MLHYRIEREDDYFSIRHVETDQELGHIASGTFVNRVHGRLIDGYMIVNNAGDELAKLTGPNCVCPSVSGPRAIALNEEYQRFRNLNPAACAWNTGPGRLELRLGALLADAALSFARGFCEASNQGLTAQTRDEFAQSMAELADLWMISQAGCFNAYTREEEPYFANPWPSRPRLNFVTAALVYGSAVFRFRYPDLSDAERDKMLGWVLAWLSDLLRNDHQDQEALRTTH